jgi:hypothetical protein
MRARLYKDQMHKIHKIHKFANTASRTKGHGETTITCHQLQPAQTDNMDSISPRPCTRVTIGISFIAVAVDLYSVLALALRNFAD